MVTDRALLAILENFQGDVPDVLTRFGAPAEVQPCVGAVTMRVRRGAGAVERGGLENRWRVQASRGFESHPRRLARRALLEAAARRCPFRSADGACAACRI